MQSVSDILETEQFLDRSDFKTRRQQMRGEGIPEHVAGGIIISFARNVHEG